LTARLRWPGLIAYALPGLPLAILGLPLNVYLPAFWAGPMGINLGVVGLVLTLVRLTDVVVDPTIGRISDRLRTRIGRRKPIILAAIPVGLLGGIALFFPREHAGPFWLAAAYAALTLGWSMIALPWQAWGAELSGDYRERTRIVSLREGLTLLGIVVSAVIPAALGLSDPAVTLHLLAVICAGLSLPALAILLLVVDEPPVQGREQPGLAESLRTALSNRPFRRLLTAWAINGIANGLPAVLFLLLCRHVLKAPAQSGPLLLIFFASGILSVPLWSWVAGRIGKHRAWCWAMLWSSAAFLPSLLLGPGDVTFFAVICLATGSGLGADLALPPSMQADVIDLDTLTHGEPRAGLFFAAWTMAQKAGNALSAGVALGILSLVGFNTEGDNGGLQTGVLIALYCLLPIALKLGAVTCIWNFPIDETEQARIRAALVARPLTQ